MFKLLHQNSKYVTTDIVFYLYPRNSATLNRNIDCVYIIALLLRLTYFLTCESSKDLNIYIYIYNYY
jgi:hypothetical protein